MYSPNSIEKSCVFRQSFGSISEALSKKLTVTGTLDVQKGEYRTLSQNQKLTYTDANIGNFGTAPFSARIITKINSFTNIGSADNILFLKGITSSSSFGLSIRTGGGLYLFCGTSGAISCTYTISFGSIIDILFTRSDIMVNIYINSVPIVSLSNAIYANNVSTGTMSISGDSAGIARCIKQSVKLVELYNKALGADEVLALYNNSKYKIYNPIMDLSKWIKGTGTYTENYQTVGNSIISKGQKLFTCTGAGTIAYPSKWADGTIEFTVVKGADANRLEVDFIADRIGAASQQQGYYFHFSTTEQVSFSLSNVGSTSNKWITTASYIANLTAYRIRITRTKTGVTTTYIKGGTFTNWTIVTVASGTNPVTEATYMTSNFFVLDLDVADQISDIRFYPYIIS